MKTAATKGPEVTDPTGSTGAGTALTLAEDGVR